MWDNYNLQVCCGRELSRDQSVKTYMKKLILISILMFPAVSLAGPWCQVTESVENCRFNTADACYKSLRSLGGYCRPNYKEAGVSGNARWCVVTATSKSCVHRFKSRCDNDARRRGDGAGCVENIELALQNSKLRKGFEQQECADISCELRTLSGDPAGAGQGGPPPGQ